MQKRVFNKIFAIILCFILVVVMMPIQAEAATVKFNKKNAHIKADICGYSLDVNVDGVKQKIIIKKQEISKFKVKSKKYSNDKKSITVKSVLYINRDVATVKASVKSVYKLKKNKWKLSSVTVTSASISSIPLRGTWQGTYVAGQGMTGITISVDEISKDGFATGTITFYAIPTNPKVPTGSFTFAGGCDKSSGNVTFAANEWLEQPDGYRLLDFYGYVDLVNKKIVSEQYSLILSKVS